MSIRHFGKGKPADQAEFIVTRRIALLRTVEGFVSPDAELLDIGCGNGATLLRLADSYRKCHGIDISEEAGTRFMNEARQGELSNCSFSAQDIDLMEPTNKTFDRIICFEVLEHVRDDLRAAITIRRLLAPGGMAAITVPNKWWIFETHGAYLPCLPWNRIPFFSWVPTKIHDRYAKARIYTKRSISNLLTGAGLRILRSTYVTAPMDRISWPPLQRVARRTLFAPHSTPIPFLATSIMAVVLREQGPPCSKNDQRVPSA